MADEEITVLDTPTLRLNLHKEGAGERDYIYEIRDLLPPDWDSADVQSLRKTTTASPSGKKKTETLSSILQSVESEVELTAIDIEDVPPLGRERSKSLPANHGPNVNRLHQGDRLPLRTPGSPSKAMKNKFADARKFERTFGAGAGAGGGASDVIKKSSPGWKWADDVGAGDVRVRVQTCLRTREFHGGGSAIDAELLTAAIKLCDVWRESNLDKKAKQEGGEKLRERALRDHRYTLRLLHNFGYHENLRGTLLEVGVHLTTRSDEDENT